MLNPEIKENINAFIKSKETETENPILNIVEYA